jgi:hypothetical protein
MTHIPHAAAYALAQDLAAVPPDERESVCADAIALSAAQEQWDAETQLLIEYIADSVRPEDLARLQGGTDED